MGVISFSFHLFSHFISSLNSRAVLVCTLCSVDVLHARFSLFARPPADQQSHFLPSNLPFLLVAIPEVISPLTLHLLDHRRC
mmetsp:Transcript_40951/g.88351  ORF Transcript_40951/g.88351 Transcript_40951/m.88351 type:complete len:82 (-) Transcript_40951:259-504(-)